MSIERVERKVSGDVQLETFISKTGYEAQKYLGLLATDTVTYSETEEMVGEQMKSLSVKAIAAGNKAVHRDSYDSARCRPTQGELSAQAYIIKPRCTECDMESA